MLTHAHSFWSLFAVAYLNLGASLIALGRPQEAAKVFRKGSRLDGNGLRDRTAHENARMASLLQLGALYADQGKLHRALAVYREALQSRPSNYPPQVSRGEGGRRGRLGIHVEPSTRRIAERH